MVIDWELDGDKKVLALAKDAKIRQMRMIGILNFKSEENEDILDYLIHDCPEKLRLFTFYSDTDYGSYCSGDYYLEGIKKVT